MKLGVLSTLRWVTMAGITLAAFNLRADVVSTSGSLFNPGDAAFSAATSSLSLPSGSITLNTDTGNISGSISGANLGNYFYLGQSQSGKVSLGVFVFDSINLPQGVSINVTGSRALVLASRHDLSLGTTLQLNGGGAPTLSANVSGAGGSGAPGGGGDGGKGGYANTGSATSRGMNGQGAGGGKAMTGSSSPATTFGGGGAGFGDIGGVAGNSTGSNSTTSLAGARYGTTSLTDLFGGSGGGGSEKNGSSSQPAIALGGGGGGGGAVELIALGTLDLSGGIEAKGGDGGGSSRSSGTNAAGGGGSGGGVILAANTLQLTGSVDASGGSSGNLAGGTKIQGGGGAGGRIALYYNSLSQSPGSSISVAFGTSATSALNGLSGTTYNAGSGSFPFQPVSTPELSSFCLAMMGALPVLLRRRPH